MLDPDKLLDIKAITLDIDGVMTDGTTLVTPEGLPLRAFDEKDGFGLRMAAMNDVILGVFTGGSLECVRKRMAAFGVPQENTYLRCRDKMLQLNDFCAKYGLKREQVMYIGDDIPDVCVLKACGVGVAPADSVPEALEAADYIASKAGGKGCVREAIELVLKAQGKWVFDVEKYNRMF